MPYSDPERARNYWRDYRRLQRGGSSSTPCSTPVPADFRLGTAAEVLALLEDQITALCEDAEVKTVERARAIGYLAGIALRAIEAGDLTARLEALETVLKSRNGATKQ